jgi:type I restriction enzyme R subunit
MKDTNDELKLVIVRDMWLTGFDAPSMHTLYVDKKMQGHNLMQAIARVNRVYKDKPGGLVVDYIGIGQDLRNAMAIYLQSGGLLFCGVVGLKQFGVIRGAGHYHLD